MLYQKIIAAKYKGFQEEKDISKVSLEGLLEMLKFQQPWYELERLRYWLFFKTREAQGKYDVLTLERFSLWLKCVGRSKSYELQQIARGYYEDYKNSRNQYIQWNYSIIFYKLKEYSLVERCLKEHLSIVGDNKYTFKRLYILYMEIKQYSKAIKMIKRKMELDKEKPKDLISLSICYSALGMSAESMVALNRAEQLQKEKGSLSLKNKALLHMLGEKCLYGLRDPLLAIKIFELIKQYYPEDIPTFDSLGKAYIKLGQHESAIKCYSQIINKDNRGYLGMGIAYRELGNYKKAIKVLSRLIKIIKKNKTMHAADKKRLRILTFYALAITFEKTKKFRKAEGYYKKILEIDPKDIKSLKGIAFLYKKRNDLDKHVEFLAKADAVQGTRYR